MSSRSKYSRKKMLMHMPLTAAAAALSAGLGISSGGVGHNTGSFISSAVIPETQAYIDSMTVYLRGTLTENKEN
jgi:hypothetical protein